MAEREAAAIAGKRRNFRVPLDSAEGREDGWALYDVKVPNADDLYTLWIPEAREIEGTSSRSRPAWRSPRNRSSPKLDAAVNFVREYGVTNLTKDVLEKAADLGIS